MGLVWSTSRRLTVLLAILTLVAGILPALVAYLGQLIVDGVLAAIDGRASVKSVLWLVAAEAAAVAAVAAAQTGISMVQSLLRALLGQRVNVMILQKALRMTVAQFEDSEFYDRLTRARREASSRPLSLVNRTFAVAQNVVSLTSFGVLLWEFSPWAVVILFLAGFPAFIAETRFSGEAFRLFYWRSPETRQRMYLEAVLAREDYVKEVRLYGLGERLLGRYQSIFQRLFTEDKSLTLRRGFWGLGLGLVGTLALYGSYGWIVITAVAGAITVGQMTMFMMVFRQGQSSVAASLAAINGMYEDNLYLSNLYAYLEEPELQDTGNAQVGTEPGAGLEFSNVGFKYPGSDQWALRDVSMRLVPGTSLAIVGENGSGKTTLIKLLTRLYDPDEGVITLDGTDVREWQLEALHARVGVIFQDFARYQMLLGENIGAGDVEAFEDQQRWKAAGKLGMVDDFIDELSSGYETQLGRWFKDGRELSGGQWQKVALARAFMRTGADVLVLDEPTSAMDAEAESRVFEHVKSIALDKMVILISHRFSTVRMADQILVLDRGRVVEEGTHEALMRDDGRYAHLFNLQAQGYR